MKQSFIKAFIRIFIGHILPYDSYGNFIFGIIYIFNQVFPGFEVALMERQVQVFHYHEIQTLTGIGNRHLINVFDITRGYYRFRGKVTEKTYLILHFPGNNPVTAA